MEPESLNLRPASREAFVRQYHSTITSDAVRRGKAVHQRRADHLYLHGLQPRKTMVRNHGLHTLRTMVLTIPPWHQALEKKTEVVAEGDFRTMVPDHGFARVGIMQVQAITPPLSTSFIGGRGFDACK